MDQKVLEVVMRMDDKLSAALKSQTSKSVPEVNKLTDTFKKLAVAIGGLVVIDRAVDWMKKATIESAKYERSLKALDTIMGRTGSSSSELVKGIQKATEYQISLSGATLVATRSLTLLGEESASVLPELAELAAKAASVMGSTPTEMLDSFTLALGRQSKMILDNMGIILDVEATNKQYAESLGKTAEELTAAEAKQAFYNEALRAAHERFDDIIIQKDMVAENTAAWDDFAISIGNYVSQSPGVKKASSELVGIIRELTGNTNDAKKASDDLIGTLAIKLVDGLKASYKWINDNKDIVEGFGKSLVWLAGAAAIGNAIIWLGKLGTAFEAMGITAGAAWAAAIAPIAVLMGSLYVLKKTVDMLRFGYKTVPATPEGPWSPTPGVTYSPELLERKRLQNISLFGQSDEIGPHLPTPKMPSGDKLPKLPAGGGGGGGGAASAIPEKTYPDFLGLAQAAIGANRPAEEEQALSDWFAGAGSRMPAAFFAGSRDYDYDRASFSRQKESDGYFDKDGVFHKRFATRHTGTTFDAPLDKSIALQREEAGLPREFTGTSWKRGMDTMKTGGWALGAASSVAMTLAQGGGAREAAQSVIPMIGSAFGPVGGAIGAFASLFLNRKTRGNTQNNPVYVHMVNSNDLATAVLNITKVLWDSVGAGGIDRITNQLQMQVARVGAS